MRYKNFGTRFFRFVTIYAFDERKDRRTDSFLVANPRWHSIQRVKMIFLCILISRSIVPLTMIGLYVSSEHWGCQCYRAVMRLLHTSKAIISTLLLD